MSTIERVSPDTKTRFQAEFIELYQQAFSEDPYYETHEEKDVIEIWDEHFLQNSVVAVATNSKESKFDTKGTLLGFACGQPLVTFEKLVTHLSNQDVLTLDQLKKSFYLSELAVNPSARNMGLGTGLTREIIKYAQEHKFERIVTVTAHKGSKSLSIFEKVGFKTLPSSKNYHVPIDSKSRSRERVICIMEL